MRHSGPVSEAESFTKNPIVLPCLAGIVCILSLIGCTASLDRNAVASPSPPTATTPEEESPLVELGGRVLDDGTGQPVIHFLVQAGAPNDLKPEEMVWSHEFLGPVYGKPGEFSLQSIKRGKAWFRILADGYLPQPLTAEPVRSPVCLRGLVVRLKRSGELRGVIYEHTGRPAVGARVFLATHQKLELVDGKPSPSFAGSTVLTDAEGHFALRGVDGGDQQVVVASPDGLRLGVVPKAKPGQELKVTLPSPATLIVRYDIPDDRPEAQLKLSLQTEKPVSDIVESVLKPTVKNGGKLALSNLTPGKYSFFRERWVAVDAIRRGIIGDRLDLVLDASQTRQVDLVRKAGFSLHGEVVGLRDAKVTGAIVCVRSPEATGEQKHLNDWLLPLFDAVTCDATGRFSTARLEPGKYTIVVEACVPEPPSDTILLQVELPDYVGTAKVVIDAETPPAPVKIKLHPRTE